MGNPSGDIDELPVDPLRLPVGIRVYACVYYVIGAREIERGRIRMYMHVSAKMEFSSGGVRLGG